MKADIDGTKENQRDETDPFEGYHKVIQSTPISHAISHVKVTTVNYEHLHPGNRSQEGLFKGQHRPW